MVIIIGLNLVDKSTLCQGTYRLGYRSLSNYRIALIIYIVYYDFNVLPLRIPRSHSNIWIRIGPSPCRRRAIQGCCSYAVLNSI